MKMLKCTQLRKWKTLHMHNAQCTFSTSRNQLTRKVEPSHFFTFFITQLLFGVCVCFFFYFRFFKPHNTFLQSFHPERQFRKQQSFYIIYLIDGGTLRLHSELMHSLHTQIFFFSLVFVSSLRFEFSSCSMFMCSVVDLVPFYSA